MPIHGWNGPRHQGPGPEDLRAAELSRAIDTLDVAFARKIAAAKIRDIRETLYGIERQMAESIKATPTHRAQKKAFRLAVNALAAKPPEFWLSWEVAYSTPAELLAPFMGRSSEPPTPVRRRTRRR